MNKNNSKRMRIAVIINKHANSASNLQNSEILKHAKKHNIYAHIIRCSATQLTTKIRQSLQKNYEAIVVGGGDGTIRTTAHLLAGQKIPLAVLPLGTFNHFAKTLNLTDDIDKCLSMIKNKKIKEVNVCQLNKFTFVNNSSIGLYPKLVKARDKHMDLFAKNKVWKLLLTGLNIFSVFPVYDIAMTVANKKIYCKTCLVFVGNNYYEIDLTNFGERKSLSDDVLSVYVLKCKSRFDLLKLFGSILFNKFQIKNYMEKYKTRTALIRPKARMIDVALDGEVFKVKAPLRYRISDKLLKIVAEE